MPQEYQPSGALGSAGLKVPLGWFFAISLPMALDGWVDAASSAAPEAGQNGGLLTDARSLAAAALRASRTAPSHDDKQKEKVRGQAPMGKSRVCGPRVPSNETREVPFPHAWGDDPRLSTRAPLIGEPTLLDQADQPPCATR